MHLDHCRCIQVNVRMLWQSLRELCTAPGGAVSIWMYLEAQRRATGVSGRFTQGFRTELHFADAERVHSNEAIPAERHIVLLMIYESHFGEWILPILSPQIFLSRYTSAMVKRHIIVPTKSITCGKYS
jgi:hypothetical protein